MAGELHRAEQLRYLHHHHHQRRVGDAKVLGERIDELLEASLGEDPQGHGGEAVEHGAPGAEALHQSAGPVQEAIGGELHR